MVEEWLLRGRATTHRTPLTAVSWMAQIGSAARSSPNLRSVELAGDQNI